MALIDGSNILHSSKIGSGIGILKRPSIKADDWKGHREEGLDIGCGEDCFSRYFAGGCRSYKCRHKRRLIKATIEEEKRHPLGVRYFVADAAI